MPLLERFNPPGNLTDLSDPGRGAWSTRVANLIDAADRNRFPQFFNPIDEGDPGKIALHPVTWPAFPATLRTPGGSDPQRWAKADSSRDTQDEYCEWGVERSGDEIARVTFTTETPDYFEQLLETDQERLFDLYEEFVGVRPQAADLLDGNGSFNAKNALNRAPDGRIAHLSQRSNTLSAAVVLVAEATVLRERDGVPVSEQAALVRCGQLGDARRSSDPQIAGAVNQLAAAERDICVADPAGLYIDEFISAGIETPDGTDAADFWKVTRGSAGQALRARFEVPADRGYSIGEIKIDGHLIETGAQLADRVRVRVVALSQPGSHRPVPQPCVG